jgi:hypothetical protein
MEFKFYRHSEAIFGRREFAQIGEIAPNLSWQRWYVRLIKEDVATWRGWLNALFASFELPFQPCQESPIRNLKFSVNFCKDCHFVLFVTEIPVIVKEWKK